MPPPIVVDGEGFQFKLGNSPRLKDGKRCMAKTRKKPVRSLFKRLIYLIMVVSGGSSGWLVKDYPSVQAILSFFAGKPVPGNLTVREEAEKVLAGKVTDLFKPTDHFDEPGTYQVTIPKVHLDSHLFKVGHTVDIQARVVKVDSQGRPITLWETKAYGERLAVAGKDELSAGWPQRPFQVEWNPGERLVIEVYDRRTGLFVDPKKFILSCSDQVPREFPLKPGTFPLEAAQKADVAVDPRNNNIVLQSLRVGNIQGERPPDVISRREGGGLFKKQGPAESSNVRETKGAVSRNPSARDDDSTIVIK